MSHSYLHTFEQGIGGIIPHHKLKFIYPGDITFGSKAAWKNKDWNTEEHQTAKVHMVDVILITYLNKLKF